MDRFRVPELLVNTSPLKNALQAAEEGACPSALRNLAESLDKPGFVLSPLQVCRVIFSNKVASGRDRKSTGACLAFIEAYTLGMRYPCPNPFGWRYIF